MTFACLFVASQIWCFQEYLLICVCSCNHNAREIDNTRMRAGMNCSCCRHSPDALCFQNHLDILSYAGFNTETFDYWTRPLTERQTQKHLSVRSSAIAVAGQILYRKIQKLSKYPSECSGPLPSRSGILCCLSVSGSHARSQIALQDPYPTLRYIFPECSFDQTGSQKLSVKHSCNTIFTSSHWSCGFPGLSSKYSAGIFYPYLTIHVPGRLDSLLGFYRMLLKCHFYNVFQLLPSPEKTWPELPQGLSQSSCWISKCLELDPNHYRMVWSVSRHSTPDPTWVLVQLASKRAQGLLKAPQEALSGFLGSPGLSQRCNASCDHCYEVTWLCGLLQYHRIIRPPDEMLGAKFIRPDYRIIRPLTGLWNHETL
jgi:hypothetical protein